MAARHIYIYMHMHVYMHAAIVLMTLAHFVGSAMFKRLCRFASVAAGSMYTYIYIYIYMHMHMHMHGTIVYKSVSLCWVSNV